MTDLLVRWAMYTKCQPLWAKFCHSLLEWIFPQECVGCKKQRLSKDDFGFCSICVDSWLVVSSGDVCQICWLPILTSYDDLNGSKNEQINKKKALICLSCRKKRPAYQFMKAPFGYGGSIAFVLREFKRGHREDLAFWLSFLLWESLEFASSQVDYVLPVPIHPKKIYRRGYNQVVLLLQMVQRHFVKKLPVLYDALIRTGLQQQQGLNFYHRKEMLDREDFSLTLQGKSAIRGKKILLVDDVITTGATVESLTHLLLKNGAYSVAILALMRTY